MGTLNQPPWARGKMEGWKEEGKGKIFTYLLGLLGLEDGTNILQNIDNKLPASTVQHPRKQCGGSLKSCIVCSGV